MIGRAWASSEVSTVARASLVAVPEVLLTAKGAESRGDGDLDTGRFGSGGHLIESTGCCRGHRVVLVGGC